MSVVFKELSDGPGKRSNAYARVGVLSFEENGHWHSFRAGDATELKSGLGMPGDLAGGLWVVDMDFDGTQSLDRETKGATLRSEAWLRQTVSQIAASFGLGEATAERRMTVVGTIVSRVTRLCEDALRANISDLSYKAPSDIVSLIERAPSLATAITLANQKPLSRSESSVKKIGNLFDSTFQRGIFLPLGKEPPEDHINLEFHFPRLSYAKRLTSGEIPQRSRWQEAPRPDDMTSEAFFAELRGSDRPVIYQAICTQGTTPAPDHMKLFFQQTIAEDTFRTCFLEEEIDLLTKHFDVSIETAFGGGDFGKCVTGTLLSSLEEVAGGLDAAHASWSVGLAAENILISATRPAGRDVSHHAEAVWLTARDRLAMMPAIETLTDMGAVLVSALYGNLTMRAPLDVEMLMLIVDAAWEAGLILPLESVEVLRKMGVPIPLEPSLFGGANEDYMLSMIAHRRQRNALWTLDSVMDCPTDERGEKYRSLTSA